MNCSEFESHLSEFVDGDISSQSRKQFLNHRGDCPTCDSLLTDFKKALTAIHSLPNHTTSPEFDKRLFKKIDELENASIFSSLRNILPDNVFPRYAVATAFAVVIAFFTLQGIQDESYLTEPVQQSVLPPPSLNVQQPLAQQNTDDSAVMEGDTNDTSATPQRSTSRSYEGRIHYVNGAGN